MRLTTQDLTQKVVECFKRKNVWSAQEMGSNLIRYYPEYTLRTIIKRIYDIIAVLKGLGYVDRSATKTYRWIYSEPQPELQSLFYDPYAAYFQDNNYFQ